MSQQAGSVLVQEQDNVLILTMSNPSKRNAIFPTLYAELTQALNAAEDNAAIGAVVLKGAEGYFCSGGDLEGIKERRKLPRAERRNRLEGLHDLVRYMRRFPKPLIAAVEGGAAGAGMSLAFACDLLVVDEQARFSVAYVRVGLTPDGGATASLGALLPKPLLMELCLTGTPIEAQRLYQLGAINRLTPKEEVHNTALEMATQLAAGPQQAIARIKELCQQAGQVSFNAQLDKEAEYMVMAQEGAEAAEGIAAFFEKRRPNFRAV